MKKTILAALIAAFLLPPFVPLAATYHDGKQAMDTELLRRAIVDGIEATGRQATSDQIALLLETSAAESKCGMFDVPYKQKGSFGIFQITKSTAVDTLDWLKRSDYRLWAYLMEHCYDPAESLVDNLQFNTEFSAAIAWLVYRRMGGKSLDLSSREKRAAVWKRIYNTPLGAGTESGYMRAARECLE